MQNKFVLWVAAAAVAMSSLAGFAARAVTAETAAAPLIISGVQITGGPGKAAEDFIELFNPNPFAVDLNGYRLVKRTATGSNDTAIKTWSSETLLPAHSFYLWANAGFANISATPDTTTAGTLADNNGLGLRYGALDAGELIDSIAWGSANNGFAASGLANPGAAESLVRDNLFSESGYSILSSNPRNSAVQQLPDEDNEPIEENPSPVCPPIEPNPEPSPDPEPEPASATTVRITEFLPNPVGSDTGQEVVELYNHGSQTVNLKNWVLDDIATWPASSNAYKLDDVNISSGQYLAITVPAGKFALNNSGGDVLTLFSPSGQVISTVSYTGTAAEGKTYSLIDNSWHWTEPSLGAANPALPAQPELPNNEDEDPEDPEPNPPINGELSGLVISEIYPAPKSGDEEFVELYNSSADGLNLKHAKLSVGNRVVSLPDVLLASNTYYALSGDELKLPLADGGKLVQLLSEDSAVLNEVTYPKAKKGESYALFNDGFKWTKSPTPGAANQLTDPSAGSGSTVGSSSTKAQVKAAAANILQKATDMLTGNTSNPSGSGDQIDLDDEQKASPVNAIIVALTSLFASAFAVYKFGLW